MAFNASGRGFSAIAAVSARTASKPRFMFSPWSPSPIAWSSAVNSSAWAAIVSATAAISAEGRSWSWPRLPSYGNPVARTVEIERRLQADGHLVARFEQRVRIGQRHQLAVADRQMQVVLVAQMLDPVNRSVGVAIRCLADVRCSVRAPIVFGPPALPLPAAGRPAKG